MPQSPLLLPIPTPPSAPSSISSPSDSATTEESRNQKDSSTSSKAIVAISDDQGRPAHRVSIACLPCRSRHLKCNAAKPRCSRCSVDGVACTYAQSRRRGHRRSRHPLDDVSAEALQSRRSTRPLSKSTSVATASAANSLRAIDTTSSPDIFPMPSLNSMGIDEDLIGLYYKFVHLDQPCCLPRWALSQRCSSNPQPLLPVLLVMQYIGSLFDPTVSSDHLKEAAQQALPLFSTNSGPVTPYQVQAMLLYGIAVYWCDEVEHGLDVLRQVVSLAVNLKMHLEPFAAQNGDGDRTLEESWRRTWWMIYVTDGHIAGSTHTFPTHVWNIELTATLPCEEEDYESGEIPIPRTLEDFDVREFLPEDDPGFSSFAQLVGLTRTLDLILSRNLPLATNLADICSQVDISLSAWCSLLPPHKRQCLTSMGEIDRQLFKANMLINTYIVDLHRQLSDLAYSPIESVARCGPPAPSHQVRQADRETTRLHTTKALLGIRRLGDLLPLPVNILTHTPFLICMIANTLVAHLSACRHVFRDRALQLERERVRSCMGALRVLGEIWPLGKRTYREMGIIAREILCLTEKEIPRLEHRPEVAPPARLPTPDNMSEMAIEVPPSAFFDFQNISQDFFGSCESFTSLTDVCL